MAKHADRHSKARVSPISWRNTAGIVTIKHAYRHDKARGRHDKARNRHGKARGHTGIVMAKPRAFHARGDVTLKHAPNELAKGRQAFEPLLRQYDSRLSATCIAMKCRERVQ